MKNTEIFTENENYFNKGYLARCALRRYFINNGNSFDDLSEKYPQDLQNFQNCFSKDYADCQILFSQIASEMGLKTPIYYVCGDEKSWGKNLIVNDDIPLSKKDNYFKYNDDYLNEINLYRLEQIAEYNNLKDKLIKEGKMGSDPYVKFISGIKKLTPIRTPLFYFDDQKVRNTLRVYFERQAIKDEIKANILNVIMFNTSNRNSSSLYEVGKSKKVSRIAVLDSGNSFVNIKSVKDKRLSNEDFLYRTSFDINPLYQYDLVSKMKKNKIVGECFDRKEYKNLGRTLKDLAQKDISSDIEKVTGYEINKEISDTINSQIDSVGEMLLH